MRQSWGRRIGLGAGLACAMAAGAAWFGVEAREPGKVQAGDGADIRAVRQAPPRTARQTPSPTAPQSPSQAPSQTPSQAPVQGQPRFRAGASVVRVDVYATRDGKPVDDLTAADLAILEDGKPQAIDSFELVKVAPAGPEETRREPTTLGEMRAAMGDPRARVFVLFLDTYHVSLASSNRMRMPLVQMLNGLIGQDDLVAVMTPGMRARDLTFTRRTGGIEQVLDRQWDWGRRGTITKLDEEERQYQDCYLEPMSTPEDQSIAGRMIARRREKLTLEALWDLVTWLDAVREERKAVLAITEGWRLYTRDPSLEPSRPKGPGGVGVDPAGRLRAGDLPMGTRVPACERDRAMLAQLDNTWVFRTLLDEANRANVSFYPVDPRGLPVFDSDLGPRQPPPVDVDARQLTSRLESLRTMAVATDGMAVVGSNDTAGLIRRVVADLSSYYLVGYSSTNTKLDGKFRAITVRTTRPGVEIRARRGYRAPTEAELRAREAASLAARPEAASPESAALASLDALRPQTLLHLRAAAGWRGARPSDGTIGVVGELDLRALQMEEWRGGGQVELSLDAEDGETLAGATAAIPAGARRFSLTLPEDEPGLSAGTYLLRVRVKPSSTTGLPFADTARVTVRSAEEASAAGSLGDPMLLRRNQATGLQYQETADPRFRRQERLRVEQSLAGEVGDASARILDLKGQPLPMLAIVAERSVGARRALVTDVTLAPFAPGDYLLEIRARAKAGELKTLVAFRIIP